MPSRLEIRRTPFIEDDNQKNYLFIRLPAGNLYYEYRKSEHRPAMRFVRRGIGAFLNQRARPIVIPPPADDEGMQINGHFFKHCENVFHRAYVAMLESKKIYTSPALLLADPDTDVPNFLNQLGDLFGNALRIVSPDAIEKYWGGKLDEFDEIVQHDGKRYHRRQITQSEQNNQVYDSGIPIHSFLDLLETHHPDQNMSYENYFRDLRRKAKTGEISPSPWPQEVLYPNQPHLF